MNKEGQPESLWSLHSNYSSRQIQFNKQARTRSCSVKENPRERLTRLRDALTSISPRKVKTGFQGWWFLSEELDLETACEGKCDREWLGREESTHKNTVCAVIETQTQCRRRSGEECGQNHGGWKAILKSDHYPHPRALLLRRSLTLYKGGDSVTHKMHIYENLPTNTKDHSLWWNIALHCL